jgi:hypothetical protein
MVMMVKNVKALIGFYLTTCSKNHKVSGFGNKKFQITKIKYLMVRQTHHLEPSRRANHIICQAPERFLAITLRHLPSVLHFPTSNPSAICFLFFALCSLSSDLRHPSSVFYPLSLSGNRRRISSSVALQIPLSVINPVTNCAGVTSNAKLAAWLDCGQIKTLVDPSWSSP